MNKINLQSRNDNSCDLTNIDTSTEDDDEPDIRDQKLLLSSGKKSQRLQQARYTGKISASKGHGIRRKNKTLSFWKSFQYVSTYSYINILLVFCPCGFTVSILHVKNETIIFILNAIAIIPLTNLLSFATEELAKHIGVGLGALLNIVFGNLVELVILISMLRKTHFSLVKSSLLGSIFANLLFILGLSFISAGWNKKELKFDKRRTQILMMFVMTGLLCLLIPSTVQHTLKDSELSKQATIHFSRGLSFILLIAYGMFLLFQIKVQSTPTRVMQDDYEMMMMTDSDEDTEDILDDTRSNPQKPNSSHAKGYLNKKKNKTSLNEDISLNKSVAYIVLLISAFLVSLNAEATVSSLTHVISNTPLSKTFLSLILLPLLGNGAELGTAISVARKENIDLAMNVAIGSTIQVATGITPTMILLGWAIGKDVNLGLSSFEFGSLLISIIIVGVCLVTNKIHWMFGLLLCIIYAVIGIGAYFMPNE